jgi:hypothetical protein
MIELVELIGALIGLLFAGATIYVAGEKNIENWLYVAFLPCLPVFYMAFGALDGSIDTILMELLFGLPFIAVGLLILSVKFRYSAYLAGTFWLAHAGWDFFHDLFFVNAGVWLWYPVFCAAIDFVVGAYLIYLGTKLPHARMDLAIQSSST